MKLWTVSLDHYATGEGRTLFGWIGYCDGQQNALERFAEMFGDYFAKGALATEGVAENDVIRHLFSPAALAEVRRLDGRGQVWLSGSLHFNLA